MSRRILVHDYFRIFGGGERLALSMCERLSMDLCHGGLGPDSFDPSEIPIGKVWDLDVRGGVPGLKTWALIRAFELRTGFLETYDQVVYSGVCAPFAVRSHGRGGNVLYCHTPPRMLFDQHEHYRASLPFWQKPAFDLLCRWLLPRYRNAVAQMDVVVANSEHVRERIQRYLGLRAEVVYPPCRLEDFRWQGQGDYYLSMARLDPLKRVDRIINAFRSMPQRRLVVASGGSELSRMRELAAGCSNIEVLGWVDEARLHHLLGNCIASIYLPVAEDFGMSAVESMATGKPVIGVDEGGIAETVVHGRTGLLLPVDPSPSQIAEAVQSLDPGVALGMRADCEDRAERFSEQRFAAGMRLALDAAGCRRG